MQKLRRIIFAILTVIGAVASIATIGQVIMQLSQITEKELLYESSVIPLVQIDDELKGTGKLTILVNNKPATDVKLVTIKFSNTGNVSVKQSDFAMPLGIDFGKDAEIIDASIVDANQIALKNALQLKVNNGLLTISPTLINPQDWFTVKIMVMNAQNFLISARIEGVQEVRSSVIQYFIDATDRLNKINLILWTILALMLLVVGYFFIKLVVIVKKSES